MSNPFSYSNKSEVSRLCLSECSRTLQILLDNNYFRMEIIPSINWSTLSASVWWVIPSSISSYSVQRINFTSLQEPALQQNVASDLEIRCMRSPMCFLKASCALYPILGSFCDVATVPAMVGFAPIMMTLNNLSKPIPNTRRQMVLQWSGNNNIHWLKQTFKWYRIFGDMNCVRTGFRLYWY